MIIILHVSKSGIFVKKEKKEKRFNSKSYSNSLDWNEGLSKGRNIKVKCNYVLGLWVCPTYIEVATVKVIKSSFNNS